MTNIPDTVNLLDDLLDREREALLAGDLDKIAGLHEEKAQAIDRLNKLDLKEEEQVMALRQKADRNQELLNSALDGIRSVARRLAEVRRVKESFETYDSNGNRNSVPIARPGVTKRA